MNSEQCTDFYIQMTILNFFHLFLLSLALSQQALFPISNCLGNCQGCYLQDPNSCVNEINNSTGQKTRCVAFYDGPNCTTGGSYYNLYTENGVLNNFANWSLPSQPQRQLCEPLQGGSNITGIGPFSANLNATKVLQFSPSQGVRRLVIKIGVGVSDARLSQLQSNSSQTVEYVEINGTLYIVTTNTTSNKSQTTQTIPFLTLEVRNILNGNQMISTLSTVYQTPSRIQTKCGFIYQYQFEVQASVGSIFQQLLLNLYLPSGSSTLWWLFDFRVEAGCSGFSVGSACSSCLTGFYPALTAEGYSSGCRLCDMACATCSSGNICLSCEKYASFDSSSQKCSYPKNYAVYNKSDSFKSIVGSRVNVSSLFFSNIYRSQNKQLTLDFSLKNNQSYFLKLYFLYPQSYIDNSATFELELDRQSWQAANLNANRPTLSSLNSGSQQLFLIPFTLDKMGDSAQASSTLSVRALPSTLAQEFYVVDPTIVQYQCSQNCLECSFSLTKTTQCKRCLPFYRTDMNCLSCANGFFPIAEAQNSRCVKCYSNCKQCRGPSRYDCTDCFDLFGLVDVTYDANCVKMVQSLYRNGTPSGYCPSAPTRDTIAANSYCSACLNQPSYSATSSDCIGCWLVFGYVWGRCGPLPTSGLSFYATQSSVSWTGTGVTGYNCSSDYLNIYGIPNIPNNLNHTTPVPSTVTTTFNNLPSHFGLRFAINLFKVDYWALSSPSNSSFPLSLTLVVSAPNTQNVSFAVQLDNIIGANICGQVSRDMIWALTGGVTDHQASSVTFSISAPDKGVFVRELQLYLSNCQNCASVGLSFSLFFLPVYADNDTQTGTDVFVTFNHPLLFKNSTQSFGSESFLNSFTFKIDSNPVYSLVKEDFLADPKQPYVKYFIPLKQSYTNATVTASTNQPDLVYTVSDGSTRQLVTSSQSGTLERYTDASLDTRKSISQLSDLFTFFTWFALITMIVAVGLGVGVVFEEFSQILQIIYLHIYITSWLLPPTVKVPLSHATRMQHLNYFSNISSIEENLFGLKPLIQSNYIFQQYNIDVYFLRSLYSILIINGIFIGWFVILKLIERFATGFRNSPNKLARFLRSIPSRPLAYFDQIWRYQFLAVMWACMIQFTSFEGNKLNLAICVLAFIVGTLWPFVVTIYTYRRHFTTNVKHFLYLYHDLFYLKTSSLCNQPKSYMYVGMRAMRLLAYAIFIALFVNQSIIGPVILIFFNLIEGSVAFFLDIYRNALYLLTRIIQNILLIVAAILCMVIYGFADRSSLEDSNYEDIGYGLTTVFVLLIINGIVRFLYLVYKKVNEWSIGTYDVGERGQLQNFDDRSPVKVPQSERLD